MTPADLESLPPGAPVFVAAVSADDPPEWTIEPATFGNVWSHRGNPPRVVVNNYLGDDNFNYSFPASAVHPTRLSALRWIAGELAGRRRAIERAEADVAGEIVGELAGRQEVDG